MLVEESKTSITNSNSNIDETQQHLRIGKTTPFDGFCGDDPTAPELIRRCLAVLRTLCGSIPAENFIYPIDPQDNPRYYETILRPMCLEDIGKSLLAAGKRLAVTDNLTTEPEKEEETENIVAEFARDVRLIVQNCACFSNVGGAAVSAAEQMLRIFERLFLDWVLVPEDQITALDALDDDRCVEHHISDDDSLVLLCDGCEGKFNMSRLDPPLIDVPKGDWYCYRCCLGRCWSQLDPRVGKTVKKTLDTLEYTGIVKNCFFQHSGALEAKPSLIYNIEYLEDGDQEYWTLDEVNIALKESDRIFPRIRCLEAVSESLGYGFLSNNEEFLPVQLNPSISDAAAQAAKSSSIFRESITTIATLSLTESHEMNSSEWMLLLRLLVTKCAVSDNLQDFMHDLESKANEHLSNKIATISKIKDIEEILPKVTDDEKEEVEESDYESVKNTKLLNIEIDQDKQKVSKKRIRRNKSGFKQTNDNQSTRNVENNASSDEEEWEDVPHSTEDSDRPKEVTIPLVQRKKSLDESSGIELTTDVVKENGQQDSNVEHNPDPVVSNENLLKKERMSVLALKANRIKAREDSYIGFALRKQMESIVATFEEDAFSQVIQSTLSNQDPGVGLDYCACPGLVCDFCGLSDYALGSPLVRVPNKKEWSELMFNACSYRPSQLIAELPQLAGNQEETRIDSSPPKVESNFVQSPEKVGSNPEIVTSKTQTTSQPKKLVSVKIRLGGKIFPGEENKDDVIELPYRGMGEFTPRNAKGFQSELRFRDSNNLPFITGSLSAHECCGLSVHNARIESMMQQHKESSTIKAEREYSRLCGRTQPLGIDGLGRSFWLFNADRNSLFVCKSNTGPKAKDDYNAKQWHRYNESQSIATIIATVDVECTRDELKRYFPKAAKIYDKSEYTDLLHENSSIIQQDSTKNMRLDTNINGEKAKSTDSVKHKTSSENKIMPNEGNDYESAQDDKDMDEDEPYEEGEEVLVESKSGKILWDAKVIAVAQDPNNDKVTGYRVHYLYWSTRFDEWVEPFRVVEPNENNLNVQEDLLEEILVSKEGLPDILNRLLATRFLHANDRSRGPNCSVPHARKVAKAGPGASSPDKSLAILKSALLIIEAALPIGAVDANLRGAWNPVFAANWRAQVEETQSPIILMGCLVLLEDAIHEKWMNTNTFHLLSCLPRHWKAVSGATVSSLSLRIWLLDSSIKYDVLNKNRKSSSNKRRNTR